MIADAQTQLIKVGV